MKKKIFKNICYFSSTYTLLLYLVHFSKEEIDDSFFVFSGQFPRDIAMRFPNHCYIPKLDSQRFPWLYPLRLFMLVKFNKLFRIPKLSNNTNLYAQDHTEMLNLLIGYHRYTLVAENPVMENILKYRQPKKVLGRSIFKRLYDKLRHLFFGPVYGHIWGYNSQCFAAIIEDEGSRKYLDGKDVIVVDVKQKWGEKTKNEKNTILYYYGITDYEMNKLKDKDIIIFTQPFTPEMEISEYQKYMVSMINKYPHNRSVIKIHPREEIDYNSIFHDIYVCKLRIPAQLFDLCGIHFKKAVTYNSSAVYDFSYDIQIDWYGLELKELFGDTFIPQNANICFLN